MHELIATAWRCDGPRLTFHVGDLHWRLRPQPGRDPRREIRLWYSDSGELAGFAWLDEIDEGDIQCHPHANREVLEPQLLASLEDRTRAAGGASLKVGGFEGDDFRTSLLVSRGYRRAETGIHHMQLQATAASAEPGAAPGYIVRSSTVSDLPQQALAIATAFGTVPKEIDAYLGLRAGAYYRNDLDLIAVTPEGRVGAFCIAWLDAANRVGLLEPVGCHPDHRRRGVARVVVLAALRRLWEVGAESVVVCPMSDNSAACALYRSVGFATVADDCDWIGSFANPSQPAAERD